MLVPVEARFLELLLVKLGLVSMIDLLFPNVDLEGADFECLKVVVFVKPIPSKLNSEFTPENRPKPNRRERIVFQLIMLQT